MTQGIGISIGLNHVDPESYEGWDGALAGCINDANAMNRLLVDAGFATSMLIDAQATAPNVTTAIRSATSQLSSGDLLVVTYAGHGAQVPDAEGDEGDRLDETWVLWDRMLIDDELYEIYDGAPAGSGIVVVSDSCHSGTIARDVVYVLGNRLGAARSQARSMQIDMGASGGAALATDLLVRAAPIATSMRTPRVMPASVLQQVLAKHDSTYRAIRATTRRVRSVRSAGPSIIVLSGCQDNQVSQDGGTNGLFTGTLLSALRRTTAASADTYRDLHARVVAVMPPEQTPQLGVLGPAGEALSRLAPFTVPGAWGSVGSPASPATPLPASIALPTTLAPHDVAPTLSITLPPGWWYEIELAPSRDALLNDVDFAVAGHVATWTLSAQHLRSSSFVLPASWWDALRTSRELWATLHLATTPTGWADYDSTSPAWAPIATRTRDDELIVWAPESTDRDGWPPDIAVSFASTPYLELELAADASLFDDATLQTSDTYAGTWEREGWDGFLTGETISVPQDIWDRLKSNDSLAIRAYGSTSPDGWVDYRVSDYVTMGIVGSGGGSGGSSASDRFSSAADVDAFFTSKVGTSFLDWFVANHAGRGAWARLGGMTVTGTSRQAFADTWDKIDVIFGYAPISLEQFLALQSIILNETGGRLTPVSEGVGTQGHPGIAYAFDAIPNLKASYNGGGNRTALSLFSDATFLAAHQHRAMGAQLAHTTDTRWGGNAYPSGFPTSTDPAVSGMILEADFYKFRGRGLIQTTFREAYLRLIDFVQNYSGSDSVISEYTTAWSGRGAQEVASETSNEDWDRLFQHTALRVAVEAIHRHSAMKGNYLDLAADDTTLLGHGTGSIWRMGKLVSGGDSYATLFQQRVVQLRTPLRTP